MKAGEIFVIVDNNQHGPHGNEKEDKLPGENEVPLACPLMKGSAIKFPVSLLEGRIRVCS